MTRPGDLAPRRIRRAGAVVSPIRALRARVGLAVFVAVALAPLPAFAHGSGIDLDGVFGALVFVLAFIVVTLALFAVVVAARLYRRIKAAHPQRTARVVSAVRYGLAGIFGFLALLTAAFGLRSALAPPSSDPDDPRGHDARGYKKGCDAGDASDCNMLGLRYKTGESSMDPDPEKAAEAFKKACEMGAKIGCRNLAFMYSNGDGIEQDRELAHKYFQLSGE